MEASSSRSLHIEGDPFDDVYIERDPFSVTTAEYVEHFAYVAEDLEEGCFQEIEFFELTFSRVEGS